MSKPVTQICERHDKPILYEVVRTKPRKSVFDEPELEFYECPACKQIREIKEISITHGGGLANEISKIIGRYEKIYAEKMKCQGCKNMSGDFKCTEHRSKEEDEQITKIYASKVNKKKRVKK